MVFAYKALIILINTSVKAKPRVIGGRKTTDGFINQGGVENMLEKLSFYSALIFVFIIGILAFILLLMGQNLRDWYLRARYRSVVT